ncbi:glycoside hydrolase family 5 protein [Atractiella rhizophila]|nr:glycoside hydrolase family 5 protein [Atractiella rhizophila]
MTQNNAQAGFISHWDTWITQADIQQIKNWGLNTVRIPVGYWIVDGARASSDPYARGGYFYLKRLLRWCADIGIYAIIDLHAAPGVSTPNQQFSGHSVPASGVQFYNQDNFGRAKLFAWNITTATVQDPDFASVFSIEALNEPWRLDQGAPANSINALISSYYPTFVNTVRSREQELGRTCSAIGTPYKRSLVKNIDKRAAYTDCLNIAFMSADWQSGDPSTYLPNYNHIMYDSHRYFAYSDQGSAADVLRNSCQNSVVKENPEPVFVGEFSLALPNHNGDFALSNINFYKQFIGNQAYAYEQGIGWTFWTYKTETDLDWSYSQAVLKACRPSLVNKLSELRC